MTFSSLILTLILKLDLDIVKMYLYTENEVLSFSHSKVVVCNTCNYVKTDRNIADRQTNLGEVTGEAMVFKPVLL